MVDINRVDSVQLDETIYNKPKILLLGKNGFSVHTITPKPERAWETFVEVLKQIEKERNKK